MSVSKSITGANVAKLLSYLLMWASGASLGAGHPGACVIAAVAAAAAFVLSVAMDPM